MTERKKRSERWVIRIYWGGDFVSPLIGPFASYSEAIREAKGLRKAMRTAGRKFYAVKLKICPSLKYAYGWIGGEPA